MSGSAAVAQSEGPAFLSVSVEIPGRPTQLFECATSPAMIGSAESNDIVIEHETVAAIHARVYFDNGLLRFEADDTESGCTANGALLPPGIAVPMELRTVVHVGSVPVRFSPANSTPPPPAESKRPESDSFKSALESGDQLRSLGVAARRTRATRAVRRATLGIKSVESGPRPIEQEPLDLRSQLKATLARLQPLHDAHTQAWNAFWTEVVRAVESFPADYRKAVLTAIDGQFGLSAKDDLGALASKYDAVLSGPTAIAAHAHKQLKTLAAHWQLNAPVVTRNQVEAFLLQDARIMEAFATMYLTLRRTLAPLAESDRKPAIQTPLESISTEKELLAYLLDTRADVALREEDLRRSTALIVQRMHRVIDDLWKSVVREHRELSPFALDREIEKRPLGFMARVFSGAFRRAEKFDRYVERHTKLDPTDPRQRESLLGSGLSKLLQTMRGVKGK